MNERKTFNKTRMIGISSLLFIEHKFFGLVCLLNIFVCCVCIGFLCLCMCISDILCLFLCVSLFPCAFSACMFSNLNESCIERPLRITLSVCSSIRQLNERLSPLRFFLHCLLIVIKLSGNWFIWFKLIEISFFFLNQKPVLLGSTSTN